MAEPAVTRSLSNDHISATNISANPHFPHRSFASAAASIDLLRSTCFAHASSPFTLILSVDIRAQTLRQRLRNPERCSDPINVSLYSHFFLYNPRRDPLKTQQRLENLARKQQRNTRTVALVNGTILLIASPLLIIIGVAAGSEYGMIGAVVGGIMGSVWLVCGLLGIAWWRRSGHKERGQD